MPAVVVEVVGDTRKLTKDLTKSEKDLKKFGKTAEQASDQVSAGFGRSRVAGIRLRSTVGGLAPIAGGLVVVGQAARELGDWLRVSGDEATTTQGIFRNAGAELLSGNFVGAIEALAVHVPTTTDKLDALRKSADASYDDFIHLKSGAEQSADSIEQVRQKMEAAGTTTGGFHDQLVKAENQLRDAADGARDYAAALIAAEQATQAYEATLRHTGSEAAQFGEKVRGAGGVAADTPLTPRGGPGRAVAPHVAAPLTPAQRRSFFDARIAREADIARDIPTIKGQVAAYRKIAAEITERIKATDDITRRFNLEADRRQVNRQATSLLEQAARDQAAAAAKATAAQEAAAREAERAAAAAKQEKLAWLDFALEKAEDTKTLADNRKVLRDREALLKLWQAHGDKTLDTARDLWETQKKIRDLGKDAAKDGDPLAGLMQVSSARLAGILSAGTGLSAAGRRVLGANIAGAEIQPMYVSVQIDGREVGRAVTKDQARTGKRAPAQTSGRRG